MSQLVQVAEIAGVSTVEVVRVATRGGTTTADWDIAHAIEAVTGRPATDTMWAGPAREARQSPEAAPANPHAVHEPETTVYAEDHLTEASEQDETEAFAAAVYSDLDDLLRSTTARSTARMVRGWASTTQARRELRALLITHPRTRGRARHRMAA